MRHQQPREIAELKGAHKKNPQLYRGKVPKHDAPIGEQIPEYKDKSPEACWFAITSLSIPGILTAADTFMVVILANLLSEYLEDPRGFAVGKYTHLIGGFARLGMTPADRNKLMTVEPEVEDDFVML